MSRFLYLFHSLGSFVHPLAALTFERIAKLHFRVFELLLFLPSVNLPTPSFHPYCVFQERWEAVLASTNYKTKRITVQRPSTPTGIKCQAQEHYTETKTSSFLCECLFSPLTRLTQVLQRLLRTLHSFDHRPFVFKEQLLREAFPSIHIH